MPAKSDKITFKVDESLSDVVALIERTIEALPFATRIYPDVYAGHVAQVLFEAGYVKGLTP